MKHDFYEACGFSYLAIQLYRSLLFEKIKLFLSGLPFYQWKREKSILVIEIEVFRHITHVFSGRKGKLSDTIHILFLGVKENYQKGYTCFLLVIKENIRKVIS